MNSNILKMSELFIKTLREDPANAEIESHKLLLRAGYIRQIAPGIFSWLPLGLRVLNKINKIVREEMAKIGAQEVHFPALLPKESYEVTGRWTEYGENIFRLKDRKSNDYLLAPTHEESFTLMVKDLCDSYKDLPLQLYQIQTKYRDEARPRAGLLRGREFIMKDAYSFDIDSENLKKSYQLYRQAYCNIFDRLNLPYVIVQAVSGAMGGSQSEEFLSPIDVGEDTFVVAPSGYAANVEATKMLVHDDLTDQEIANLPKSKKVETPNLKKINEISEFLNVSSDKMLKTVYLKLNYPQKEGKLPEKEVVIICIPGDRDLDIKRAQAIFEPAEVEIADEDVLKAYPELVPGFVGPNADKLAPEGVKPIRIFYDDCVYKGSMWVTGANIKDAHFVNMVAGRDFDVNGSNKIGVVQVKDGDMAYDGSGKLEIKRGVEIGHIFALGDKYTKAFDLKVLDQNGKAVIPMMGSYGIGITRALALLAQLHHDEKGLKWPKNLTPVDQYVVIVSKDEEVYQKAYEYADKFVAKDSNNAIIVDDRKVSPGIKFKDAELLGIPEIVVFGRGLNNDKPEVEIKYRNMPDKDSQTILLADLMN